MAYMYRDLEGAVGDVLSTEAHTDDVFPRLGCCVEDVKCSIFVFNYVHIHLASIWSAHCARHLALPSSLCIHSDDSLLSDLNSWTNTSSYRIQRGLVTGNIQADVLLLGSLVPIPPWLHSTMHQMQNIWNAKATDGLRKVGSITTSGPQKSSKGQKDYFNLKVFKLIILIY